MGLYLYLLMERKNHRIDKAFAFSLYVSNLPCGVNGALYFIQMDPPGGNFLISGHRAGAKCGPGEAARTAGKPKAKTLSEQEGY
jgi:hypothetical protein